MGFHLQIISSLLPLLEDFQSHVMNMLQDLVFALCRGSKGLQAYLLGLTFLLLANQ